jgi:hypothetical protein
MTTWNAYIKETTVRRLYIEVEADDWETAEEMARDIAAKTTICEWNTEERNDDLEIEVEEA